MASIDDFWARSETSPFEWGSFDCLTWAASYVEAVTGCDPASRYRGTYSTAFGARRLVLGAGGLVALASVGMDRFRSGETADGVAIIERNETRAGAVLVAGTAWLKSDMGVCSISVPKIIKGWSLCHKQLH